MQEHEQPGRLERLVDFILSLERAALRLEHSAVLNLLSRAALVSAIASNAKKAQAVFAAMSEAADWFSPWSLAVGLELALGVASYALAERVQRNARLAKADRAPAAALWGTAAGFAVISTIANVRYFSLFGGSLVLAAAFGVAAPAIALANAFLTGDVAGAEEARAEARALRAEARTEQRAHLAELEIQAKIAAHQASAARADARRARAEAGASGPDGGGVRSGRSGQDGRTSGTFGPSDRDGRLSALLSAVRTEPDASYRRLSDLTGIPRTTVFGDMRELEAGGRVRRNGRQSWQVLETPGA